MRCKRKAAGFRATPAGEDTLNVGKGEQVRSCSMSTWEVPTTEVRRLPLSATLTDRHIRSIPNNGVLALTICSHTNSTGAFKKISLLSAR